MSKKEGCAGNFVKMALITVSLLCVALSGCVELDKLLKPTSLDRETYRPTCEQAWRGKTIYIDFDVNRNYWGYSYASSLAYDIRDKLTEDVVDDGCFHVTDRNIRRNFSYMVGVHVSNPRIRTDSKGVISSISAKYRIKTYDNKGDLVKAMSRKVAYERPMFVVVTGNSQSELLENYTYNVSVEIRKMFYESLRDNLRGSHHSSRSAYKTTSSIKFHTKPGSRGVIEVLRKGAAVYPTGKKYGKWWQVKADGKVGWVHSDFVAR